MRPVADGSAEVEEACAQHGRDLAEQHLGERRGQAEERRGGEAEESAPSLDRARCTLALAHTTDAISRTPRRHDKRVRR